MKTKNKSSFFGVILCIALLIGVSMTVACGGENTSTSPLSRVAVSVSPDNWQMNQGGTQTFMATVTGTTNTAVTWRLEEGAVGGSITSQGVYTAPMKAGTFHIIATSHADTSKSALAVVTLPTVSVSLNNPAITIDTGGQYPFVATVVWTVNQAVTWRVQEGPSGGSVTQSGVYTAPGTYGTYHVIATSQADTTQTATATVTVALASVSVSPSSDVLGPAGIRMFSATVNTSLNTNVSWSVEEGAGGGTITTGGQYTAPTSTGSFHVVATSVQDPSKSATATVDIVPSGFQPTGAMTAWRLSPAAVLLQTGKVLIAGGYQRLCYGSGCLKLLSSAELYDPASGTFTATGSMSVARVGPTAALLTSGKVLLVGGDASAELYDPTTGKFAGTGNMTVSRSGQAATLLNSGKVLVVGGVDSNGSALASAELYDPNSGTFIATGSMAAGRSSHTATLLASGKVLIAGGTNGGGTLDTAELYDALSGSFSSTGYMTVQRAYHAATALATGNVLITGGRSSSNSGLASAEIYDAATGSFSATTNMTIARAAHVAALLPNGTVLVAGGDSGVIGYTAEVYDPGTAVFTQTGSMEFGRSAASAVSLPLGRVLVTGGTRYTAVAEVYK